MATTMDKLSEMRAIHERDGTRAVLIYLNGLTEHRFTALYRFDDASLRNLYFFDRDNPEVESSPEIPVMASYCVFVRDREQTFVMSNSLENEEVRDHPKRLEVRSYCGVPLLDEDGRMFGTICHFDHRPLPISDENAVLMEAVAHLLKGRIGRLVGPATG